MTKQTYSIVGSNFVAGADLILRGLQRGAKMILVREPENKFDKNAVAVYVADAGGKGWTRVGYVPKAKNVVLSQFIDQSGDVDPEVSMAFDSVPGVKFVSGKFAPSPNSSFPQVEVGE